MERKESLDTGSPVPGDHVFVPRCVNYSHHGIFLGDKGVIHYQTPIESGHPEPTECKVVLTDLGTFLGDDIEWYIYRYGVRTEEIQANQYPKGTYSTTPSDEPDVVIERAYRLLRDGFGHYNIVGNNCEDFAVFCKTGRRSTESALFSAALSCVAATRQAKSLGYRSPLLYVGCAMGLFTAGQLKRSNEEEKLTRKEKFEEYKEEQTRMDDLATLEKYEQELLGKHEMSGLKTTVARGSNTDVTELNNNSEKLVSGIKCMNGFSFVDGTPNDSNAKQTKNGTSGIWVPMNRSKPSRPRETEV